MSQYDRTTLWLCMLSACIIFAASAVSLVFTLACASREHAALELAAMPRPPRNLDGSEGPYAVVNNYFPPTVIPKGAVTVIGSTGDWALTSQQIYTAVSIAVVLLVVMCWICLYLPRPSEIFRRLFQGKKTVQTITVEQPIPPEKKPDL